MVYRFEEYDKSDEHWLTDLAKWGLYGEYSSSGCNDGDGIDDPVSCILSDFKSFLDEDYPHGFKMKDEKIVIYRLIKSSVGDLDLNNLGNSWYADPKAPDETGFYDMLEYLKGSGVIRVMALCDVDNIDMGRSLWERSTQYAENEIVVIAPSKLKILEIFEKDKQQKRFGFIGYKYDFNVDFLNDIFDPEDLDYDMGISESPHVTILYGLEPYIDINDLRNDLNKIEITPEDITYGSLSIFKNPRYDVLHISLKSEKIVEYNKLFKNKYPSTKFSKSFKPHITIAYLKKGKLDKYKDKLEGVAIKYAELIDGSNRFIEFSSATKKASIINL